MDELALFDLMELGKKTLGVNCKKFTGALAVQILRRVFKEHNITVSPPNIYIKGCDVEIDLAILKEDIIPEYEILYDPNDVVAVLEIKTSGSFSRDTSRQIKENFMRILKVKQDIHCAYVTLSERKSYKYKVSSESIGFPVYTLAWHSGPDDNRRYDFTGDFPKLIQDVSRFSARANRNNAAV